MALRVLIAPDKFKGTLTSRQAADAIAAGWRRLRPDDSLDVLPMSDGGDGFGEVMSGLLGAEPVVTKVIDAAGRPCRSRWWWRAESRTAIVECAQTVGLAMLPPGKYHPFQLDTRGLGLLLLEVAQAGCRRCLVGLGGSATNDGGFGVARALGWEFKPKRYGAPIERWTDLARLWALEPPSRRALGRMNLVVAVDVQNPLLGAHGASRVYGPQKGLRAGDMRLTEGSLRRLARVVRDATGRDCASLPGAGAAGGLGFGLVVFCRGRIESGSDLIAGHSRLERRIRRADLVVTGEGALDRSSVMGKGVGEIARRCRALEIPCLGLAGVVRDAPVLKRRFQGLYALAPNLTTEPRARAQPAKWLKLLAERVASQASFDPRSMARPTIGDDRVWCSS